MWQTIDSAPQDGTRVLLFCPTIEPKQCFGYFVDEETLSYGVSLSRNQGWLKSNPASGWVTPTHWMLPADPE